MSDSPAEYHKGLAARVNRHAPFIYQCRSSTNKVKFYSPSQLSDAEKSIFILGVINQAQFDELGATVKILDCLKAWVGDDGYDLLIKQDKLSLDEVGVVVMDAVNHFQGQTGTVGES